MKEWIDRLGPFGPQDDGDLLVTIEAGYVLGPPMAITTEPITMAIWAQDGECLALGMAKTVKSASLSSLMPSWHRTAEPEVTTAILGWNSISGELKTLWRLEEGQQRFAYEGWMRKADVIFGYWISHEDDPQSIRPAIINYKTGLSTVVETPKDAICFPSFMASDDAPFVILTMLSTWSSDEWKEDIFLIDSSGEIVKTIYSSSVEKVRPLEFFGEEIYLGYNYFSKDPNAEKIVKKVNVVSGAESLVTEDIEMLGMTWDDDENVELFVEPNFNEDPDVPTEVTLTSSELVSDGPLVVSRAATFASLSPDDKNIIYLCDGVLFVRPVIRLMGADVEVAQAVKARTPIIAALETIGILVFSYSADNDGRLPSIKTWREDLARYTNDTSIFEGFVLTCDFEGDTMEIDEPAEVELGHVVVPGGRIVCYLRGSARFVPHK